VKAQLANRYVEAAVAVLAKETAGDVTRGTLQVQANPYTSDDVTTMVGVNGAMRGSVYISMSIATATSVVATMLGQEQAQFDELAQSGIAELLNVIAGAAGVSLADGGIETSITPPLMLVGSGARLSSVEIQRLVVPLETRCGEIRLHIALRDA
jgi:chemotaxis protein CheX